MITSIHFEQAAPKFTLTTEYNAYDEGETVVFTLETENIDTSRSLMWVVDREEDIDPSVHSDSIELDSSGNATWQFDTLSDYITEGQETLNISIIDEEYLSDGFAASQLSSYTVDESAVLVDHSIIIRDTSVSYTLATGTAVTTGGIQCYGGTASMGVHPTSGVPPYQWTWRKSPNSTIIGTTEYMNNLSAGTYTCYVNDSRGVGHQFSRTFTEPDQIILSSNSGVNSATWSVQSGGVAPFTASIQSPQGTTGITITQPTTGNFQVSGLDPNTTYVLRIEDSNGCSASRGETTSYQPLSITGLHDAEIKCHGGTTGATGISVSVSGGSGTHTISWVDSSSTAYNRTNLTALTYVATVTDSITGETDTTSFVISEPSAITTSSSSTDTTVTVTASGGTGSHSIEWADLIFSTQFHRTGLNHNTTYYYTVYDSQSCSVSGSVKTQPCSDAAVEASANISQPNCTGDSGTIDIVANYSSSELSYLWNTGATTKSITAAPGVYSCNVSHTSGCGGSVTLENIQINNAPEIIAWPSIQSDSLTIAIFDYPEYGHLHSITWSDSSSTSFNRTGLTPNTTYYFTVKVYYGDCADCYCTITGSATTIAQQNNQFYRMRFGVSDPTSGFCDGFLSITTVFWTDGSDIDGLLGSYIYTNSGGTSTFNGSNLYYVIDNNSTTVNGGSGYRWIRIGTDGQVISSGITSCSTGGPKFEEQI